MVNIWNKEFRLELSEIFEKQQQWQKKKKKWIFLMIIGSNNHKEKQTAFHKLNIYKL